MRPDIFLKPVRLTRDMAVAKAGDVGTVVEVYAMVEFVADDGRTTGMVMAHPDSFELVEPDEEAPLGRLVRAALTVGRHWLDQQGVNAQYIDELAQAVKAYDDLAGF